MFISEFSCDSPTCELSGGLHIKCDECGWVIRLCSINCGMESGIYGTGEDDRGYDMDYCGKCVEALGLGIYSE